MTTTYLGGLTIGEAVPGPVAAIHATAPMIEAQLTAFAELTATPPTLPSYADMIAQAKAQIATLEAILAQLLAAIAAGIQPPSPPEVNAGMAKRLDEMRVQLDLILNLVNLFGTAGVHAYAYAGRADAFGGELSSALSGGFPGGAPSDDANAIVLATTLPATWIALSQFFKVTQ